MAGDALLADTDILLLLCAGGLLERTASKLGISQDRVLRLPAAPFQIERSRQFRDAYPADVLHTVLPHIRRIAEVTDAPQRMDVLERFALNSGIQSGEALLFALAAENPGYIITTGDKTALIALAGDDGLRDWKGKDEQDRAEKSPSKSSTTTATRF